MICWCTGRVTEIFRTFRIAAFASLAVHLALGWWALCSSPNGQARVDQAVVSAQRMVVQLTDPLPLQSKTPALKTLSALETEPSANVRPARRANTVLKPEANPGQQGQRQGQGQGQGSVDASQSISGAQVVTQPATVQTPAQAPAALNLDTSRAAKSVELQRRKSGLSAAVDAMQSENAHVPETLAFARLAPAGSSIVSETIMADGTRLIKFSAGGCMRVVNPSARHHDDIRKSAMENC